MMPTGRARRGSREGKNDTLYRRSQPLLAWISLLAITIVPAVGPQRACRAIGTMGHPSSQALGTRLFPSPPGSIPVLQLRSTRRQRSTKYLVINMETTFKQYFCTLSRLSINWPLVGTQLEPQPPSQPPTSLSGYHPGPDVSCPPVFCALKCHTTNNVSEAGLMWPNEETQACDRIAGGGQDDGPPSFSCSWQTRCSRWRLVKGNLEASSRPASLMSLNIIVANLDTESARSRYSGNFSSISSSFRLCYQAPPPHP